MANLYVPTVLITGAKSGLGLEFARQFAQRGWNVIATHRNAQPPELTARAMEEFPRILYEALDVSDPAAIKAFAAGLKGQPIDVLINNAGISYDGSSSGMEWQRFGQCDPELFHLMYGVNVLAPVLMAEAFVDHLRAGRHKKIVSLSSTNGSLTAPLPGRTIYYKSTKAALNRAMICVAEALEEDGIAVALLHPGTVRTEKNIEYGAGANPHLLETSFSVAGMMHVIDELSMKDTGKFFLYDSGFAPW